MTERYNTICCWCWENNKIFHASKTFEDWEIHCIDKGHPRLQTTGMGRNEEYATYGTYGYFMGKFILKIPYYDDREKGSYLTIMASKKSQILDIKKLKHKELKEADIRADIDWIYDQLGKKSPKIVISQSYKAQKSLIKKATTKTKGASLEATYNQTIRNKGLTKDITEEQIEELRERYGSTSENFALDRTTEVLTKNTANAESDQYFGAGFELFYSLDMETDKRLYKMYEKGIFNIEYYEKECHICEFPVALRFDKENRLHGGEKAAIQFADGNDYFLVRDVYFDAEMWEKIQSRKMPIEEILSLPNVEQRSVAIEFMGPESLLEQSQATKIHGTTERGNTLYHVKLKMGDANSWNDGGSYTYTLLQYACPSTDRKYASFVPENIMDADEAMAWKFSLTKEEYLNEMVQET